MEYNSFYGGRRGASFIIVKSYKTEQEMIEKFALGGQYKEVNYEEYVIIDTENKNDITNGKVYRRGYNYTGDFGGAEYIGQIVGPAGLGPHAEVIEKSEVAKKYQDAEATGDQLDYRYGTGTLDTTTNDLVPGAKGEPNNRTFDDETDKIHWEYFSLRDAQQLESTCYIGYQVPYTVFDFLTEMVTPYNDNGDFSDMTNIIRQPLSEEHPFYEQWKILVPQGVKGDMLNNFRLYTPSVDETMLDAGNVSHTLQAGKTVLIYDYVWYDKKQNGEKKTLYLGEYEVIDDILIDNDGTVTVKYKSNRNNTVFEKRIQWIDSVELKEDGKFTVNYNNGAEPYITNLKWVRNVLLAHDGKVTLVYNNGETEDLLERLQWIDNIQMNENGKVTVTWNNSDTKDFEQLIKWVNEVNLEPTGELTVTFNDGKGPQHLDTLRWVTSTVYDEGTGTITINYNTNENEIFDWKFIKQVNLTEEGNFTVIGNDGYVYLDTEILYPKNVTLEQDGQLTVYKNNGEILYETQLIWIDGMSIENDRFVIHYNNGVLESLDDLVLNQIQETAIPVVGEYAYHLLVYYTAIEKRGEITHNGITGWKSLGQVKDYNGIMIGHNINSISAPELDDPNNALEYLSAIYPQGIVDGYSAGKVVTIGPDDDDKRLYAYDYEKGEWFYLGNPSGVKDVRSVIVGKLDDVEIAAAAQKMPTGSLWFVLEGDE